jgi:hypothetical protein
MRMLRDPGPRVVAALLLGLVAVVVTAPLIGVIRCADGLNGGRCDSRSFTAFGADAWSLPAALLLGAAVAIIAWVLLVALARRRSSSDR